MVNSGDGVTDDTAAIQQAFNEYGNGSKVIFVDAGTYILTDTVTIPKDAKIHGEAWSQFAAFGSSFSDAKYARCSAKNLIYADVPAIATLESCSVLAIGVM
jgi:pectin methylesterase-like acyl-CoA thioesterase